MKPLSERQEKLFDMLKKQQSTWTISDYALELGVSNRTVHYDLNKIEPYLNRQGYELRKVPGIGIQVEFTHLKDTVRTQEYQDKNGYLSPFERQRAIFKQMLFNKKIYTYNQLATHYFVSESSIAQDFTAIKKRYLTANTLKFHATTKGTKLYGSERQVQNTYVLYNHVTCDEDDIVSMNDKLEFMRINYGKDIVDCVLSIMNDFTNISKTNISQIYLFNIINILVVLTYRARLNKHMTLDRTALVINEAKELPNRIIAIDILHRIEKCCDVQFTTESTIYIARHLNANKIEFKSVTDEISQQYLPIVERIVATMSALLHIDLMQNKRLVSQLSNHFGPMMTRLRNNIFIKNPLLEQIKHEFRLIYDLAWIAFEKESELLGVRFNEHEISFVVIYFQNVLDQIKQSQKVLIVCHSGLSTSELVATRVKNILPPLDIIEVASLEQVETNDLEYIDFIISTIPLENIHIPVIQVSPILTDVDVKNISNYYQRNFIDIKFKPDTLDLKCFPQFIDPDCILFGNEDCKEDVINKMVAHLEHHGVVTKDYGPSIYAREQLAGTDMISGVSIPHGNTKYVCKTVISFWFNQKNIKWNQYNVQLIIFVNIADEDICHAKMILKDIYQLISSKQYVDEVLMKLDKESFYNLLGGNEND